MKKDDLKDLYLDLIKKCLLGFILQDPPMVICTEHGLNLNLKEGFSMSNRQQGMDIPSRAHTMIGSKRLDNLQYCVEQVLADKIPGDLIETGVWRGGATILMRAILKSYGVGDRLVWVADSFAGFPLPDTQKYPFDNIMVFLHHDQFGIFNVSLEEVKANFDLYGLLDEQVRFLKGWFKDTLPTAPIRQLAVLRLDGDLYESTSDALTHLYPKLSVGGYIIIDDFNIGSCTQAVSDYRKLHHITEKIIQIDDCGVYWQREH